MALDTQPETTRRAWMSVLAKAPAKKLKEVTAELADLPDHRFLRSPESGTVMLRGRAGGTGSQFNLGEMTVTRCTLQLASGETGHAVVQGRDKDRCAMAALMDAMMQTARSEEVETVVLDQLRHDIQEQKSRRSAKAAATKVEFFTMVRGED